MFAIRRASERGHANHGWLDSYHTFSFGSYYDPKHLGFSNLRVINDDTLAPGGGFATHGHTDMEIISYVLDGALEHKDSMGNTGNLGPGGAQWMKAASGVIHSEMPKQENGLMRGFQLWINLPAANKMDPPCYQEYKADAFPVVEQQGGSVKVVVGNYADAVSPITDDLTEVRYLDVQLQAGSSIDYSLPEGQNSLLYLFEGDGEVQACKVANRMLVTLAGRELAFGAGAAGARFLLVSGKPLNEPVVQYGPFVMSTRDEIDEAMRDYRNNTFVRDKSCINRRSVTGKEQTGA